MNINGAPSLLEPQPVNLTMTPTFVNEEHRKLMQELDDLLRRPLFEDPDYVADREESAQDLKKWGNLWLAYRCPAFRSQLPEDQ
jgi:hypothetical protein